jgi:predicted NBD/HSP70 family sugar kinase
MKIYIGLDIGGTKILAATADKNGQILHRRWAETPLNLTAGLKLLEELTVQLRQNHTLVSIGAAIGGPLDWKTGVVSPLHQPEWRNVPLKPRFEEKFACPFRVDVDTNVAALGEYIFGNITASRFLYLTISTGMGGGFLIDGKIYRGAGGSHPEVGHQSIHYRCSCPQRVQCECGAPDCLEALLSGNAVRRIYQKPAEELTAEEWEEVGYNLGQGLRNLAALYTPDVIVLGGGVAIGGGDKLLKPAIRVMKEHLKIVPHPEVRLSGLGYDTALLGAIALAMQVDENLPS